MIMLVYGKGRWEVSLKPKMIQTIFFTCLKYFSEYWYMESTSAMLATTKYITEPLVATGRYFSRARVIFSSVISASFSRVLITPEVTWEEKTAKSWVISNQRKLYRDDRGYECVTSEKQLQPVIRLDFKPEIFGFQLRIAPRLGYVSHSPFSNTSAPPPPPPN